MQDVIEIATKKPLVPQKLAYEPGINVAAIAYPFSSVPSLYVAREGLSIEGILEHLLQGPVIGVHGHVYINEAYIPRENWSKVYPKEGTTLSVRLTPAKGKGKKNPLATILSIAVIAAAAWAGPAIAGAMGFAAGSTGATIAGALGSAVVNAVGSLLVSAIAPPPKQRLSNTTVENAPESQTLFIEGARNSVDHYGVVPVILGKHRFVPKLGANTFTSSEGANQYVTQLFVWGLGKYEVTNMRIGETPIEQFQDVFMEHFLNGEGSDAITALYPNSIFQEDFGAELTQAGGWVQRTTQTGCDSFSVDVTFPQGLCQYDSQSGARLAASITVEIEYSIHGMATWIPLLTTTITEQTNSAVRKEFHFTTAGGQYDVRIKRTTADSTSDRVFDKSFWSALRTTTFENPINIKGLSFSVMKIRATDQLNGAVDQFNADVQLVCPSYDYVSGDWIEEPTRNPADIIRWVMQNSPLFYELGLPSRDSPNARPLANGRIMIPDLEDFHDFCRERGFEYNGVIDFKTSVWDVLNEIASAGRAKVTLVDGKWSVIIDRPQTVITQHVTPANSWGLNVRKIFSEVPHALRVQFINEEVGYLQDEMLVFADGYNESNATKIVGLQLAGITKPSLVYQHAREHLASMILRPHEYTFNMDVEHLVMRRGGLIKFAHDVPLIGTAQGYITELKARYIARTDDDGIAREDDDGNIRISDEPEFIDGVILDREVTFEPGKSYSIRFRNADTNTSVYCPVVSTTGTTNEITFVSPLPGDTNLYAEDLFMFGETARETIDLVVREIVPGNDFTARIVAVDASPEIFEASQGVIPPFNSLVTIPSSMLRPQPPEIISIQTGASAQVYNPDGSVSSRMLITMQNNNDFDVLIGAKIKASDAQTFENADVFSSNAERVIIQNLTPNIRYDLQLYYKRIANSSGAGLGGNAYSPIIQQNLILFEGIADKPPNVENFAAQLTGTTLILTWQAIDVIDFRYYEIRYSPAITGVSWYTSAVIKTGVTNNETVVPAGTGTYLIKAFDRDGNESDIPAETSLVVINERFNAVEIMEDDPVFAGTKTNTVVNGTRLELDDLSLAGEYEFENIIDLQSVFSARIISHINAAGRNDGNTMDKWPSLSLLGKLDGNTPANWYATILVSLTQDDPSGTPTWSPYEPITTAFYTFRALRAKVIMAGNGTNVTPSIEELRIVVDMEDRVEKALNITVPASGLTVTYAEAFNATPTLVPALLDGVVGDVVSITDETPEGFKYAVTNGGVGVERHINYHVIGYGRVLI